MQHKIKQNMKCESKTNRKVKQKKRKRIIKTILNNNHDGIR